MSPVKEARHPARASGADGAEALDEAPAAARRRGWRPSCDVEQCREEIVDAAERCVLRNGLHQLKLRDIASESGKSLGNLYNYFQNKEAIVEALVRRRTQNFLAMVRNSTAELPGESDAERMTRHITELVDAYMDPEAMRLSIFIASEALVNPRVLEIESEANADICRHVIELIRRSSSCRIQGESDEQLEAKIILIRASLEGMRGALLFNPGASREAVRRTAIERMRVLWLFDEASARGRTIEEIFPILGEG